jgi:hypothetical protein
MRQRMLGGRAFGRGCAAGFGTSAARDGRAVEKQLQILDL